MAPDIKAMRHVLEVIERNPGNHDQGTWTSGNLDTLAADNGDHPPCGTTLCFGGWHAFLTAPKGTHMNSSGMLGYADGRSAHCADVAESELGLTDSQARALFYGADTLAHLAAMVDELESDPEATGNDLYLAAGIIDRL